MFPIETSQLICNAIGKDGLQCVNLSFNNLIYNIESENNIERGPGTEPRY